MIGRLDSRAVISAGIYDKNGAGKTLLEASTNVASQLSVAVRFVPLVWDSLVRCGIYGHFPSCQIQSHKSFFVFIDLNGVLTTMACWLVQFVLNPHGYKFIVQSWLADHVGHLF